LHRSNTEFSRSDFGGFRRAIVIFVALSLVWLCYRGSHCAIAGFASAGAAKPAKQQPRALSTNLTIRGLQAIDPLRS
jgi:hypothetical protein